VFAAAADRIGMEKNEKTAVAIVRGDLEALSPLAEEAPVLLPLVSEGEREWESLDYIRKGVIVG
jgi:hypothetical protein